MESVGANTCAYVSPFVAHGVVIPSEMHALTSPLYGCVVPGTTVRTYSRGHAPRIAGRTGESAWGMKLCALFQQQLGQNNIGMLMTRTVRINST